MDSVHTIPVVPGGAASSGPRCLFIFDAAGDDSEFLHLLPSDQVAYQERHKGSYVVATLAAAILSSSGRVGSRGGTVYSA